MCIDPFFRNSQDRDDFYNGRISPRLLLVLANSCYIVMLLAQTQLTITSLLRPGSRTHSTGRAADLSVRGLSFQTVCHLSSFINTAFPWPRVKGKQFWTVLIESNREGDLEPYRKMGYLWVFHNPKASGLHLHVQVPVESVSTSWRDVFSAVRRLLASPK